MGYNKWGFHYLVLGLVALLAFPLIVGAQNKKLTFEDVMKWEDISDPQFSDNGEWLAYSVWPDRGDGEVRIRNVDNGTFYTIELGDNPKINRTGQWVGANVKPKLVDQIKAKKDKPKQGLALLNTANGETVQKDSVKSFEFSNDGKWALIHFYQKKSIKDKKSKNEHLGTEMVLRSLESGEEYSMPFVAEVSFDSTSQHLAYAVVDTSGEHNGLYYRDLNADVSEEKTVVKSEDKLFSNLEWDHNDEKLAFTQAQLDSTFETEDADLKIWKADNDEVTTLVAASDVDKEWALRTNNDLEWTDNGERLFFGLMPREMVEFNQNKKEEDPDSVDVYSREQILGEKEVDVWHYDDPRIKTHEKDSWNRRKKRTYRAVYHMDDEQWIQLADLKMPNVVISQNPNYVLGQSRVPYLQEMTWDGFFSDYYIVDLKTGERKKIVEKLRSGAELSPKGNYVVFYRNKDWHLYNVQKDLYRNLTEDLDVPFFNEDHDYPYPVQGYGTAGWLKGDEAIMIYDKYDVWKFSTDDGKAVNLTKDGRDRELMYRIERVDEDRKAFDENDEVLIRGYYDHQKTYGFYTLELDKSGTEKRLETAHKYDFISSPENSDRILYSREKYDEYPNLWISEGPSFEDAERITELHLNLHDTYNWGSAELIEWSGMEDGQTIRGALIKPDNYNPDKQYPVLIYYYRFFSQRAYEFNNITNDDRPTLPQWVSDNYVVFLPDIRFEVGTPGFASTKSLVPGVQKLIEMGIADPDKLGLHGHSWSGYQTAFMVTQTDIFDAAIAGAPVSNMTSAYSGIRWGSGLARQFQYEQTQSRIGGSLWEYPERYIENSPVFYADRIDTPLLMMFGDEDTAVPWYQGIEMYLAMRRLDKDAVFLQYRDEPHHLQKYANKLDYAIKMKEYFDHYLRGEKAPKWITDGVPYRGK
ncbi:alpha/beta hydrolase family protein [Fodinibius halophilus]|uniref:S9 family peptidase n=1 Tax=Fodinibius halophilus TaxID=1736908 RepID=A0A6M1T2X1_9BACT|nr:prolyl oligopeptidase family serine peptidase [Fodinibius halophilus]NGP88387.1 S9 family peptidase [Fodinibius halophilus]